MTTAAAPARIELRICAKLVPEQAGATVAMTGTVLVGGNMLNLTAGPLVAGSYRVDRHVVSDDTHRVTGNYVFAVRSRDSRGGITAGLVVYATLTLVFEALAKRRRLFVMTPAALGAVCIA